MVEANMNIDMEYLLQHLPSNNAFEDRLIRWSGLGVVHHDNGRPSRIRVRVISNISLPTGLDRCHCSVREDDHLRDASRDYRMYKKVSKVEDRAR